MEYGISCDGLTKTYVQSVIPAASLQERLLHFHRHRERVEIRAVRGVSFTVGSGEWLGICGPNGCGKSTLLKMLAGLLPADAGSVTHRGKVACFLELGAGFHPERSAEENLRLFAMLHGIPRRGTDAFVDGVVAFAGVESHRLLPLKCYSTGMRLRLGYAAVAHVEADTYLLDEILAVGDESFVKRCREHLESLRQANRSVVVAGASYEKIAPYCDRVLLMRDGVVVEERVPDRATLASASR